MNPSLRFVRSLDRIVEWILSFFLGKMLDIVLKKSWTIARPRVSGFVSRLTWYFPAGIFVITYQALSGLGYVPPAATYNIPILDQFLFGAVTWSGLILIGLGMSMGGSRRYFAHIAIVGSRRKH